MPYMNTVMTWQTSSTSSADTERIGELLGKLLKGGEVIELRADLGGGKTTFTRGLAAGLGSDNKVASPTFTLSKVYEGHNDLKIHHFDFYRLNDPGIVADQLAESINDEKVITIVEWSDIVQDVLPDDRLTIEFKLTENSEDERLITLTYPESKPQLIRQLETDWTEVKP
jgi:tRNA threonylcarbamoyladenosine biosynthesis protein TsaE